MKKYYHINKKLLKSNFTRLKAPCKITFAITYACTFLCKTCNIGRNYLENPTEIKKNELTLEEIGQIFQKAKPSWLQITGGEPFMRDMHAILRTITENDKELYVVHTTTNGLATKNIVDSVKKILTLDIPRFVVSVSIDGFEDYHNYMRGIKNSFHHCLNTFNQLRDLETSRFNVFISYTSSPHNVGKFENFLQSMKNTHNIDPKYVHLNIYHTSGHFYNNKDQPQVNNYQAKILGELDVYEKYKKGNDFKIKFLETKYRKYAKNFVKTGKSPLPCKALNSSCFLDPYGNVFPCTIWDEKVGNLKDFNYDLKTLWQHPQAKKAQKDAQTLNCPNCWTSCEAYQTIAGNMAKSVLK